VTASDFDFMTGSWTVQHRRLESRLTGCSDWMTFSGTSHTHPILGGSGNVEDNWLNLPDGQYRAAAVRSFDAARGEWAIWWLDGRKPWHLDVPLTGRFHGQVGMFFADDVLDERPIRVRFTWDATDPDQPRWEQGFSADHGRSWEANWKMKFTRTRS
jgi:hypothetical protein